MIIIRDLDSYMISAWRWLPLRSKAKRFVRRKRMHLASAKYSLGVLAVVINDDNALLLFHHTYREANPWGLPGGGLERESMIVGLQRELDEESGGGVDSQGFEIEIINLIRVAHDGARRVNHIFECSFIGGSFHSSNEVDKFGWFPADGLPDIAPSQRPIVESILQFTDDGLSFNTNGLVYINPSWDVANQLTSQLRGLEGATVGWQA